MKCQNIKKYEKNQIRIPPDDNKLGTFDTSVNSRLIMFINKIDLPHFSVKIENPVCHRLVSNDLRIL